MTDIYGGLLFENLVNQDEYFNFQLELFEKDLIQDIQLRIAHPLFTPNITIDSLPNIFSVLPDQLKLFLHLGAENLGVDLGQNLDECGVFNQLGSSRSWDIWNRETLNWGLKIGRTAKTMGVIHSGYGSNENDNKARELIIETLKTLDNGEHIVLENVPPIVDLELYPEPVAEAKYWSRNKYWGFGGTPDDMAKFLKELGTNWRCLIDFTHLIVMVNQANELNISFLSPWKDFEKTIQAYLNLHHCSICHFSGEPNTLVDCHMKLDEITIPNPVLIDAFSQMEAVCLEISFNPKSPETNIKSISNFYKQYKIS